jgi:hypothetical protein
MGTQEIENYNKIIKIEQISDEEGFLGFVNIQYQVVLHFSCLSFLDDLYKGISLTFK